MVSVCGLCLWSLSVVSVCGLSVVSVCCLWSVCLSVVSVCGLYLPSSFAIWNAAVTFEGGAEWTILARAHACFSWLVLNNAFLCVSVFINPWKSWWRRSPQLSDHMLCVPITGILFLQSDSKCRHGRNICCHFLCLMESIRCLTPKLAWVITQLDLLLSYVFCRSSVGLIERRPQGTFSSTL